MSGGSGLVAGAKETTTTRSARASPDQDQERGPECSRRDWPRILWYDLPILGYVLLFEQSSLPAYAVLREQLKRALEWRREIWKRVRALPNERLGWFG